MEVDGITEVGGGMQRDFHSNKCPFTRTYQQYNGRRERERPCPTCASLKRTHLPPFYALNTHRLACVRVFELPFWVVVQRCVGSVKVPIQHGVVVKDGGDRSVAFLDPWVIVGRSPCSAATQAREAQQSERQPAIARTRRDLEQMVSARTKEFYGCRSVTSLRNIRRLSLR